MVALHNQSETIEEESEGLCLLDRTDCIYAEMEVWGKALKRIGE